VSKESAKASKTQVSESASRGNEGRPSRLVNKKERMYPLLPLVTTPTSSSTQRFRASSSSSGVAPSRERSSSSHVPVFAPARSKSSSSSPAGVVVVRRGRFDVRFSGSRVSFDLVEEELGLLFGGFLRSLSDVEGELVDEVGLGLGPARTRDEDEG